MIKNRAIPLAFLSLIALSCNKSNAAAKAASALKAPQMYEMIFNDQGLIESFTPVANERQSDGQTRYLIYAGDPAAAIEAFNNNDSSFMPEASLVLERLETGHGDHFHDEPLGGLSGQNLPVFAMQKGWRATVKAVKESQTSEAAVFSLY